MEKKNYPNKYLNPNFVEEGLVMHLDATRPTRTKLGAANRPDTPDVIWKDTNLNAANSPTVVWKDMSGNGIDAKIGHFGILKNVWNPGSLTFDGSGNDFVEVTSDGTKGFANQKFTIEVWASPELGNNKALFSYDTSLPGISSAYLRLANNSCFFNFNIDGETKIISGPLPLQFDANKFNQFICTFESGAQKIYVNGEQIATGDYTGEITYSPTPVHIGKSKVGGTAAMFKGKISHVLYYNRVLEKVKIDDKKTKIDEVLVNYCAGSGDIPVHLAEEETEEYLLSLPKQLVTVKNGAEAGLLTWPRQFINVKDYPYNAKGDGVMDDTDAIQKALDAAANYFLKTGDEEAEGGANIYIPEGV